MIYCLAQSLTISLSVREVWGSIPGSVKSVKNGLPPLRVSSELYCPGVELRSGSRYTLQRNITSIMKI